MALWNTFIWHCLNTTVEPTQTRHDIVIIVLSLQKVFAIVHIVAYVYLTATFVY